MSLSCRANSQKFWYIRRAKDVWAKLLDEFILEASYSLLVEQGLHFVKAGNE